MKNHKDVCYAKDTGFIEFEGLKGSIKTGCPDTPDYKSRYCAQHKNKAFDLLSSDKVDEDLGSLTGPALRFHQTKQHPGNPISRNDLRKEDNQEANLLSGNIANISSI